MNAINKKYKIPSKSNHAKCSGNSLLGSSSNDKCDFNSNWLITPVFDFFLQWDCLNSVDQ